MLDLVSLRRHFQLILGSLVYFDSAATTQKPKGVLAAMDDFYKMENGNANRGMHPLAEAATRRLEGARKTVATFLNAKAEQEIVFTKGTTESLNLLARSFGETMKKDDIVVLSILEHHSNIVPWVQLKEKIGIEIVWIHCDTSGQLNMSELDDALKTKRVKLVSITGQSNVLGVRPDLSMIIKKAHEAKALVCVDAAQLVAHGAIDVQELDCDFLAFSGHKMYGPTGIGVLHGKLDLLKKLPPFLGGGGMVQEVTEDGFIPADVPEKFEAGTQPIAEAVGLEAAINWLNGFPKEEVEAHEKDLVAHAVWKLGKIEGLKILGSGDATKTFGCISFTVDSVHPHDLTEILGQKGFCLRAGNLCAGPLHMYLKIPASTRMSFGIYNTKGEIDACVSAIEKAIQFLRG